MPVVRHKNPGRYRAVVYAVVVHLAVIAVIAVGFRWTSHPRPVATAPVQAVAVADPEVLRRAVEEQRQREAEKLRAIEERKQAEEERRRQEAETKRLAEVKRREDQERAKQAQVEKRRKEERRASAKEALARQLLQEEQDRERERQQQQERQKEQERAQLAADQAARAAAVADRYTALIQQKVIRHWIKPPGVPGTLRCTVRVRLVPGGDVVQAAVISSSGNPVFDRSVESAVYRSAPLPLPAEAELFEYFREIDFVFSPEGKI